MEFGIFRLWLIMLCNLEYLPCQTDLAALSKLTMNFREVYPQFPASGIPNTPLQMDSNTNSRADLG